MWYAELDRSVWCSFTNTDREEGRKVSNKVIGTMKMFWKTPLRTKYFGKIVHIRDKGKDKKKGQMKTLKGTYLQSALSEETGQNVTAAGGTENRN